jgi:hypothetical protein
MGKEMLNVRLIKMLGLAAVAVLVPIALLGVGNASADSACLEDPAGGVTGKCPENKVWTGPIIGLSNSALLSSSILTVLCKSEFLANYVKNEGEHVGVLYLITSLSFANCTGGCSEAAAEQLSYLALASALKQHIIITKDKLGNPSFLFKGCIILGEFTVNCLFEAAQPLLNYILLEDGKGTPVGGAFGASEVALVRGGDSALCPKEPKWSAVYSIYEDESGKDGAPLFLTALP